MKKSQATIVLQCLYAQDGLRPSEVAGKTGIKAENVRRILGDFARKNIAKKVTENNSHSTYHLDELVSNILEIVLTSKELAIMPEVGQK